MDRFDKAYLSRGIAECVSGAAPLDGELAMGVDIGTTSISAAVTNPLLLRNSSGVFMIQQSFH